MIKRELMELRLELMRLLGKPSTKSGSSAAQLIGADVYTRMSTLITDIEAGNIKDDDYSSKNSQ